MSKQQSCNYHTILLAKLVQFCSTFDMSDLAGDLLAQYYGFSKNPKPEKFLSIHECVNDAKNDVQKLIEQSTADTNDDDTSKKTEIQANDVENEESNSDNDIPIRSSRALDREVFEDNEETSEFDIIFDGGIGANLLETVSASSSRKAQDLASSTTKTISTILGPEDNEGNDSYFSLSEEALPDSASDISSGRKKSSRSSDRFALPSTPLQAKIPVYNETFIDLASTNLTSFSIEIIKRYVTIRMLYLENNNLIELPKELFIFLPQLQWLDVRNNQLTSLPASIRSHPSLETILLEGNKIEKLPLELCLVPKLKILNIAHNPIIEPPEDIIALGCSSILNYLRAEWNKLHPDEPVKFIKRRIEPKLSTILCYQSPREKRLKLPKIRRMSKSANDIGDGSSRGTSVRKRSRAYKPNNRCDGKGTNFATEQRMYWMSKAKDLLSAQSAQLQKLKDSDIIKEWRRDKQSFSKSMEKISRRNEDDIPFAIDIEDYPAIKKQQKVGKSAEDQIKERLKFASPANINTKLLELSKSLQKLEIAETSEILTPKSKQQYLQTAIINKLSHFQKEIQTLRRYNEILAPINSPNNSS